MLRKNALIWDRSDPARGTHRAMQRYSNTGSSAICAAAPWISAGGACCIPSGVPRMPIGGAAWFCAGIFTRLGGLIGPWRFAAPGGLF